MKFIIKFAILCTIYIVFSYSELISQKSLNLRASLTEDVFKEFDDFIKKYAPSDSAFNAMIVLANKHFVLQRSAVSAYIFNMYKPLFPKNSKVIENQIEIFENVMISQTATHDMYSLYIDYIKRNAPSDNAFFALQRITDSYIIRQEWDSTIMILNTFKPLFPELHEKFDRLVVVLKEPLQNLVVKNLGPNINSVDSEWDPSPTLDGKYIYFSADHRNGGLGAADIWVSENIDGQWQKAVNIGRPINYYKDETVDNVSPDGTGLLLSGNFSGTYGEYDIYFAEKDSIGWKPLEHLPKPVNSEYHEESGCLSADGNVLIFTSDRPGGIGPYVPINKGFYGGTTMGNMDIYVSLRNGNSWSTPINLGPILNTPYAERAAYLHPDGKTLYFSSNGHHGLGRLDVYKTTRLNDTSWQEWSEPVNLGKEINGAFDDWGYVVTLDGSMAYFAKDGSTNGYGNWDIFSITLPEKAKPEQLITITGNVIDSYGNPISASITWEDLETGKIVGHIKSDPRDGSYLITLKPGKRYGYFAESKGYYPTSHNINLKDIINKNTIKQDIVIKSVNSIVDKLEQVTINNIFFDFNKSELKNESFPELNRLVNFLMENSDYRVLLTGHTDNTGDSIFNTNLSLDRAKAVSDYLIKNGIARRRIVFEGKGSLMPVVPNDSEENRAKNRRVEFMLFDK
ncbi:OmpA family protein [Candidatus Kapaibacterium sp.]